MADLIKIRKTASRYLVQPFVWVLARAHVTPNTITIIGFLVTIAAGVLVAMGHLLAGGIVVLVAGFFDMLDGALARSTNQVSRFGGILDSTLDRLSEAALLVPITILYAREGLMNGVILAGLALPGSFVVSYIRARAEAAGIDCEVGFFTRTERVIVLALGLLLDQLFIALGIIVFFSYLTVVHRLLHAWRQIKKSGNL